MNARDRFSASDSVKALRALSLAGALSSWGLPTVVALAALAVWEAVSARRVETAFLLGSVLVPFFAGTGALSLAKLGRFDLLVGAGVTRRRIVCCGLAGSLAPLLLVGALAMLLSGTPRGSLVASGGMVVFMAGVGFLGGLAAPPALVGVVWIVARFAVFTLPWGFETLQMANAVRLSPEAPAVPLGRIAVVLAAIPELAVGMQVPGYLSAFFGLAGIACIVVAVAWFERSDWPGKRME